MFRAVQGELDKLSEYIPDTFPPGRRYRLVDIGKFAAITEIYNQILKVEVNRCNYFLINCNSSAI